MSLIKFRCSKCQKKIGVKPAYAGRKIKCPGCHSACRVPQIEEEEIFEIDELMQGESELDLLSKLEAQASTVESVQLPKLAPSYSGKHKDQNLKRKKSTAPTRRPKPAGPGGHRSLMALMSICGRLSILLVPLLVAGFFMPWYINKAASSQPEPRSPFDRATGDFIVFESSDIEIGGLLGGPLGELRNASKWVQGISYIYAAALLVLLLGGLAALSDGGNRLLSGAFLACAICGWIGLAKVEALATIDNKIMSTIRLGGELTEMTPWPLIVAAAGTAGVALSEAGVFGKKHA